MVQGEFATRRKNREAIFEVATLVQRCVVMETDSADTILVDIGRIKL
jgi:hypothetical protein